VTASLEQQHDQTSRLVGESQWGLWTYEVTRLARPVVQQCRSGATPGLPDLRLDRWPRRAARYGVLHQRMTSQAGIVDRTWLLFNVHGISLSVMNTWSCAHPTPTLRSTSRPDGAKHRRGQRRVRDVGEGIRAAGPAQRARDVRDRRCQAPAGRLGRATVDRCASRCDRGDWPDMW
jgi:hypothetical protein